MPRFAFLLVWLPMLSFAQDTRYVSDELQITLRTGQGNSFQIVEVLPSGTALSVLEETEKYARVTTPKGNEGWVLNQYLIEQPIARDKLIRAEARLARITNRLSETQNTLKETSAEKRKLEQALTELRNQYAALTTQSEKLQVLAAKPAQIEAANQKLTADLERVTQERDRTIEERDKYRDDYHRQWFLAGAGVVTASLLLGLLFGLTITRLKKRRWGEI